MQDLMGFVRDFGQLVLGTATSYTFDRASKLPTPVNHEPRHVVSAVRHGRTHALVHPDPNNPLWGVTDAFLKGAADARDIHERCFAHGTTGSPFPVELNLYNALGSLDPFSPTLAASGTVFLCSGFEPRIMYNPRQLHPEQSGSVSAAPLQAQTEASAAPRFDHCAIVGATGSLTGAAVTENPAGFLCSVLFQAVHAVFAAKVAFGRSVAASEVRLRVVSDLIGTGTGTGEEEARSPEARMPHLGFQCYSRGDRGWALVPPEDHQGHVVVLSGIKRSPLDQQQQQSSPDAGALLLGNRDRASPAQSEADGDALPVDASGVCFCVATRSNAATVMAAIESDTQRARLDVLSGLIRAHTGITKEHFSELCSRTVVPDVSGPTRPSSPPAASDIRVFLHVLGAIEETIGCIGFSIIEYIAKRIFPELAAMRLLSDAVEDPETLAVRLRETLDAAFECNEAPVVHPERVFAQYLVHHPDAIPGPVVVSTMMKGPGPRTTPCRMCGRSGAEEDGHCGLICRSFNAGTTVGPPIVDCIFPIEMALGGASAMPTDAVSSGERRSGARFNALYERIVQLIRRARLPPQQT
jgi:hypothetical protein